MWRVATIGTTIAGAFVFGRWLSLAQLLDILQPLIVALSIMAAALLVRLNRGMPTLDWKSLEPNERQILTQKVVELTQEYMIVLSVFAATLAVLLVIAVNKTTTLSFVAQKIIFGITGGKVILGFTGALVGLSAARMAYIVWRDYDIVRLQKKLIDESAKREALEKASQEASSKVTAIRAAGVRGGPRVEPSSWPE